MEIVNIDEFTVSGLKMRTCNSDEMDPTTAKIGKLWQDFYQQYAVCKEQPVVGFGVYSNYESDEYGEYDVTAGVKGDFPADTASAVTIASGPYLRFHKKGGLPAAALALWQEIWTYFQTDVALKRTYVCDFEEYLGVDEVAIFIGLEEEL